eukprot:CAMPEP_0172748846 /NCGR_PEP_ID=MMETSP1074-20121228/145962_1 /TAXON_ID=2916 /ORGANISM="Ceratium fusus, Strain PA161109" /LENGTH=40 /DNA_ID= /DNA_START= /DNA_END= /DNA_ORIENTATION=
MSLCAEDDEVAITAKQRRVINGQDAVAPEAEECRPTIMTV